MKLYSYHYHSGATNPVGKITRRYIQLILLPVVTLFGLYTANQLLYSEQTFPDAPVLDSEERSDPFLYFDDIASTTVPTRNANSSADDAREESGNTTVRENRIVQIEYATCSADSWKSEYPLTEYKKRNGSVCRGPACELNSGREPILVDKTKQKYPCNSFASCVTVTVKTRHRFNVTARLINSLHMFYPEIQVIVTDDEDSSVAIKPTELFRMLDRPNNIRYEVVPAKIGEGRKIAAEKSRTPYILVLDDDHVFVNTTRLITLLDVLQHTDASIVGGNHVNDWKHRFQGVIHLGSETHDNSNTSLLEIYENLFHEIVHCFPGCYVADVVKNIFMADKDAILNAGSWDNNLLCWEHEEFFCTMRSNNIKIVYCEEVEFLHVSPGNELRNRRKQLKPESMTYIFQKWGLESYHICRKPQTYFSHSICPKDKRDIPN